MSQYVMYELSFAAKLAYSLPPFSRMKVSKKSRSSIWAFIEKHHNRPLQ